MVGKKRKFFTLYLKSKNNVWSRHHQIIFNLKNPQKKYEKHHLGIGVLRSLLRNFVENDLNSVENFL